MKVYHSRVWGEISFYKDIKDTDKVLIEACENYQKRSSRNRYAIATTNGLHVLSIPLKKGKNNRTNIKDVAISYDENWTNKHLTALKSAYKKAPYFDHYFDKINSIYQKKYGFLFDFNLASMEMIKAQLKLSTSFDFTKEYLGQSASLDHLKLDMEYEQVFEYQNGFISDCCILDLLFCTGPEAILYL